MIQGALDSLGFHKKDKLPVDREATEKFPSATKAEAFKKGVRSIKKSMPKKQQKKIAEALVDEDVAYKDIPRRVRQKVEESDKTFGHPTQIKKKEPPMIGEHVMELEEKIDDIHVALKAIVSKLEFIKPRTLESLVGSLKDLDKTAQKIFKHVVKKEEDYYEV